MRRQDRPSHTPNSSCFGLRARIWNGANCRRMCGGRWHARRRACCGSGSSWGHAARSPGSNTMSDKLKPHHPARKGDPLCSAILGSSGDAQSGKSAAAIRSTGLLRARPARDRGHR